MMTATMTHDAKFWDKTAPKYFKSPIKDVAAYQRKLATTRRYLTAQTRLLELGCGTGGTAIKHAPYVNSVHAVDISEEMLSIGREQAKAAGVDINWQQADTADFSAPAGSYDAVLALSHLHLLKDWRGAISKVHTLLSPDGVFISSTVCLGGRFAWLALIAPLAKRLGLFPTLKIFTAKTFRAAVEDAGFEILEDWRPPKSPVIFIVARRVEVE
ncbi:MAG: class I SAM-dependent methyltransferase [Pseudomonadota bacterium]